MDSDAVGSPQDREASGRRPWSGSTMGARWGHATFFLLCRMLGRRGSGVFLFPVTLFYYLFVPRARHGVRGYLARRFPNASGIRLRVLGYRHVLSFANILLDGVFARVRGPRSFAVDFPDTQKIRDALGLGRGVLMLGAHVGSWDMVSRFFGRLNTRVSLLMFEGERREIRELYRRQQADAAPFTVIRSNAALDAVFAIRQALSRNEIVVVHGDRSLDKGVPHRFLGAPALFPDFPYRIAAALHCPVVISFGVRTGRMRYTTIAKPHFFIADGSAESVQEGLGRYVAALEELLAAYPFQWHNFFDFWAGEDSSPASTTRHLRDAEPRSA